MTCVIGLRDLCHPWTLLQFHIPPGEPLTSSVGLKVSFSAPLLPRFLLESHIWGLLVSVFLANTIPSPGPWGLCAVGRILNVHLEGSWTLGTQPR